MFSEPHPEEATSSTKTIPAGILTLQLLVQMFPSLATTVSPVFHCSDTSQDISELISFISHSIHSYIKVQLALIKFKYLCRNFTAQNRTCVSCAAEMNYICSAYTYAQFRSIR